MKLNETQMKIIFPMVIAIMLVLAGCQAATPSANPAWVDQLIQHFESNSVTNPPLSIWRYDYKGQTVYFVPAYCCDIYSILYDANGTMLCAPDGGFTGDGDGKCPDFFDERSNGQLVWQDTRTP
jgi:hypothetical protein